MKVRNSPRKPAAPSPKGHGPVWLRPLMNRPALLLALAPLFWSGNFVVGRAVHDTIPPIALSFWRWLIACLIIVGFALPHLRRDGPILLRRWPTVLVLAATGVAAFNTLVYIGLAKTTAINGVLLQSTMPMLIIAISFLLFKDRPHGRQIAGLAASLTGVLVIVTGGRPDALLQLDLNSGDAWIFAAVVSYAIYSILLRYRPEVHPSSFLAVTFALGTLLLAPLYGWEHTTGRTLPVTTETIMAILYVALLPSVLAYYCWNHGVEHLGANRAGQFLHLMPIFGSALAVLLLGETLRPFHLVGGILILGGILVSTRRRP